MTVVSASLRARSGVFAISGGAILWGTTGVVAHAVHARTGLSAVSIAFYRTFTAALVLVAVRGPAIARLIRTARRGRRGGQPRDVDLYRGRPDRGDECVSPRAAAPADRRCARDAGLCARRPR